MWCEEGHLQDIFKNSEYFEKYNYKYSSIRIIFFFTWATAHLSLVQGSALVITSEERFLGLNSYWPIHVKKKGFNNVSKESSNPKLIIFVTARP